MNRRLFIRNIKRQIAREIINIMYEDKKKVTIERLYKEFNVYEPGDQNIVSMIYREVLDGYYEHDEHMMIKNKEEVDNETETETETKTV